MATLPTPLQWAQRPSTVLITIPLTDAKDVSVKLLGDALEFSCTSNGKQYAAKQPLFAEVVPDESSHVVRDRCIEVKIQKKDTSAEYWPRLTKDKTKSQHITIDWGRWKDEDEVAAAPAGGDDLGDFGGMGGMGGGMGGMGGGGGGMGGMDMQKLLAQMGGMGGAGGAGGMPDFGQGGADSDDEEDEGAPPPLE